MNGTGFQFACLNDPRLAAHALSPSPAWLWSADASHMLWANPPAAAIFEADSPAAAATIRFDAKHPAAAQIARLAGTLPQGGAPRLERLRGFGAGLGGALVCLCSRISLADNTAAILVVSTERAGKELPLPERAHRLLSGIELPAAIFTADGELIDAMPEAQQRFGEARDLIALGAEKLAGEATRNGTAEGEIAAGRVTLLQLGAGSSVIALLAGFTAPAATAPANEAAVETTETPAPSVPNPAAAEEQPRRFPLRFVWQTDATGRFTFGTEEFVRLLGPQTAAVLDRPWADIAAALKLDPHGAVASAFAARDTWSGIVVHWPVDDDAERLAVEMSGLPVFDRERQFAGFRGFGICRDIERLEAIERRRAHPPAEPPAPKPAEATEPAAKVVPFPTAPALSPGEQSAFQELARELGQRLKNRSSESAGPTTDDFGPGPLLPRAATPTAAPPPAARYGETARDASEGRPIFDRLPVGILVYRLDNLIYANRAFLDWAGYPTLDALAEAGGLYSLYIETAQAKPPDVQEGAKRLAISTVNGDQPPVEGHLFGAIWNNENALVLMLNPQPAAQPAADEQQSKAAEMSLRRIAAENRDLETILDTATDGVLMLDRAGRVLSANRSAEALFGYDDAEIAELSLEDLLAPESRCRVLDHLDRLARNGGPESLDAGREAIGLVRQGGLVPLYITMGRISDGEKLCAVLRDITAWKRTEEELINAKQEAEKASTAKSEFLAKVSHEIRTPLNAIIGFSEVMMDERFGPVGNERYRQYLKDIHSSGGHLISLLNDLVDLSKIEAGKLELTFVSVSLNDIVQQCVAVMQEQANRERVIIRTSLPTSLPQVLADARSVRQIALNLLSNSIRFTGPGGQVIVSTALTDDHEVVLRVRDTGHGMSEKELQTALEPFRQIATAAHWGVSGLGLGLPITKALAEANHARFHITSKLEDGTLVEVAFPATRVLAQ
jgi:PAS domain S-box-containing protein